MSRYENYAIKNNVFGTLSAPISSLATSIQLKEGEGARFSVNMLATLENVENGKVMKREIVLITAINGDVLTVERKYKPCPANDEANTQGQVSYAFSTDDTISAYITKEHFDEIDKSINDIYDNGVNKLRTEVVSGLQIKVNAGPVLVGSAYYDFDGGNLTLTDNATNYVEIDEDGYLVSNTTGWIEENSKVSKVITSGGEITSIEDWRLGTVGGKIGGVKIHELTEKDILNPDDELIIADSENIYQNKKIKAGNIIGYKKLICAENISKGDVVGEHTNFDIIPTNSQSIGQATDVQKIATKVYGNGVESDFVKLYLGIAGTGQNVTVRIETDNNGAPSGTLVNENATGTVVSTDLTSSLVETQIDFADSITLTKDTPYWLVIAGATVDNSNYIILGIDDNIFNTNLIYNGNDWISSYQSATTNQIINTTTTGGMIYNNVVTIQAVFNTDIYLEKVTISSPNYFARDSILKITNNDTGTDIYNANISNNVNIQLEKNVNYTFTISHPTANAYQLYSVSGANCPLCSSITVSNKFYYGGDWYFVCKYDIQYTHKTYIKSQLFSNFVTKIDTSNINTFSDIVGVALNDKTEGENVNIAINDGVVENDSRDLIPGQDYFFISNTISDTPIASTNIIYLGKAISKTAIKVDIKKAIYNLSSDIAPFTGLNSGNPIYKGETVSGTLTAGY